MAEPLRIGIAGALGRMGRAIAAALEGRADAVVALGFDRPGTEGEPWLGASLGRPQDAAGCDVLVDFTTPAASTALAQAAAARGAPALVIGSTGWGEAEDMQIWNAAKAIPIVKSGNYSLGVNVLAGLVQQAARKLAAADWDIEVFEAHHRRKVDAPSGTALMLGEAAARGRQTELAAVQVRARDGITGARPEGAIGFSVLRGTAASSAQACGEFRRRGGDADSQPLGARPQPVRPGRRRRRALGRRQAAGPLRHDGRAGLPGLTMDAILSLDATAQLQALNAGRIGAAELLQLTRRRYEDGSTGRSMPSSSPTSTGRPSEPRRSTTTAPRAIRWGRWPACR